MADRKFDETRYLDIEGAAAYTSFSVDSLYRRVSDQTIPFLKIGSRVRFDKHALDKWMLKHRTRGARPSA
jgi:excisionase family DNA binding protein